MTGEVALVCIGSRWAYRKEGIAMQSIVNGQKYDVVRLRKEDLVPGVFVREAVGRRAYRVLCIDGEEIVMRNLRKPALFEAVSLSDIDRDFRKLLPQSM